MIEKSLEAKMHLYYKILANDDDDLYSSYSGSIPLIQLFEGVPYEKVALILAGGSELIKTVMDISFTPDIPTNGLYEVEFVLSLNDDIPDYDLDYYNDIDSYDDDDDDDDYDDDDGVDDVDDTDVDDDDVDGDYSAITWIINYNYDSHWDCYCKTRQVCGCGCDPLHDGW